MGLQDQIRNHPIIIVAGAFAVGLSMSWAVANSVLVRPRDFEIERLRQENSQASELRKDYLKAQDTIASFRKDMEIVEGVFEVYPDNFEFEVIRADLPVLVLFTASWVLPGERFIPTYLRVCSDYRGRVKFVWINTERYPQIATKYEVTGLPTLAIFVDGEIAKTKPGALSERSLKEFIDRNL